MIILSKVILQPRRLPLSRRQTMHVLNVLRLVSPAVVLPFALSLFTPPPAAPIELPGIRPIVTQRIIPRRLFILLLLTVVSTSYLADGAVFVAQTTIQKEWLGQTGTAWAVYSLANVVLWAGTSVLVSWKNAFGRNGLLLQALSGWVSECIILGFQARDVAHGECPGAKRSILSDDVLLLQPTDRQSISSCISFSSPSGLSSFPFFYGLFPPRS